MKKFAMSVLAALLVAVAASAQAHHEPLHSEASGTLGSVFKAGLSSIAVTEPDVPDPEQVYRFSVRPIGGGALLRFDIVDCCYLYRDKTKIELVTLDGKPAPAGARLGSYTLPPGKVKEDEFVGKTEVYYHRSM